MRGSRPGWHTWLMDLSKLFRNAALLAGETQRKRMRVAAAAGCLRQMDLHPTVKLPKRFSTVVSPLAQPI